MTIWHLLGMLLYLYADSMLIAYCAVTFNKDMSPEATIFKKIVIGIVTFIVSIPLLIFTLFFCLSLLGMSDVIFIRLFHFYEFM